MAQRFPKNITEQDRIVGKRIRIARLEAGLSQARLSEKLGITFQQMYKYENGSNRCSVGKLAVIAQACNRPIAWFFGDDVQNGPDSDLIMKMLAIASGLELARHFLALPNSADRQIVLTVARALARSHPVSAAA